MNILGIMIGEDSTAALMRDGEIVAAASEERFSRLKNDETYPRRAIDYCMREGGISGKDLDVVALAGLSLAFGPWVTRTYTRFSIQDHVRAQREFWYPRLYENSQPVWTEVFKDKLDLDQFPGSFRELVELRGSYYSEDIWPKLKAAVHKGIAEHLGISEQIIRHVDHHTCHAAYAYWGSPLRDGETLVLTADAYGDNLSATVGVADGQRIRRVHAIADKDFRLARLYRYVTLILGMKPNEYEYKVMGLAAYAKPVILEGPYQVFKDTMYVDGLDFKWKTTPPDMYFHFKEQLEGYRFDGIAGGLQRYLEETMSQWVRNAIRHTGARRVVFSGGIGMNVKMHKVFHEDPAVEDLFVCGSASDESLALGVCYHVMEEHCEKNGQSPDCIRPLNMYLGPCFSQEEVDAWVAANELEKQYKVESNVTPERVAQAIANGVVIGRCAGRMEFGARALGNRSIVADPRRRQTVDIINRKIKNRDFWMPFTPTILAECADEYVVNAKGIKAPFMTIAFASTEKGRRDLPAALHVADQSVRPQILEKDRNPEYHRLISAFRKITGVGGVLNTSFNIHGEPIVCCPDDALHVFRSTEIDGILVENTLILKPQQATRPTTAEDSR